MFRSPPTIIEGKYSGSISSRILFRNTIWFSFGAYTLIRAIAVPESVPYTTRNLPSGSVTVFIRLNGVPWRINIATPLFLLLNEEKKPQGNAF
ncbi:hypothetical protein FKM82_020082 [Ascaphus truei]